MLLGGATTGNFKIWFYFMRKLNEKIMSPLATKNNLNLFRGGGGDFAIVIN
jgi:hypothetical protein